MLLLVLELCNKASLKSDNVHAILCVTVVGLIDYLVSDEIEAHLLREHVIFKIGK